MIAPEAPDVRVYRARFAPDRRNVYVDHRYVGMVARSTRRWARGWQVLTARGKDLGDRPRQAEAVAALVEHVTRRRSR